MIASLLAVSASLALSLTREEGFGGEGPISEPPEQTAIRRRIAKDRVRMRYLRREEASLLGGFRRIEADLRRKERKRAALLNEGKAIERRLSAVDGRLVAHEADLRTLADSAARRALAMHRIARTSLGDVLRRASRTAPSRRLRDWLRIVLSHDKEVMSRVRAARSEALRIKAVLATERAMLELTRAAVARETEDALELREEQAALIEAVRTERRASERLARELVEQARRQDREAGVVRGTGPQPEAQPGGFGAQKGRLPWPTAGQVFVPFGKKVDPRSGLVLLQRGIDLAAPLSAPVRAVFGGTVVYASPLRGYGVLVIVDHQGFFTVYGHLGVSRLEKGALVHQHEVLGFVGGDGKRGSFLYFEIRQGQVAVDPQLWLAH